MKFTTKLHALMIKLDRLAAWVLLLVILLFILTGYGMTKGVIDYELANSLHVNWLIPIGFISLLIHGGWGVHISLKRWRIWNGITKILLAVIVVLLFAGGLYVEYVYDPYAVDSEALPMEDAITGADSIQDQSGYMLDDGQTVMVENPDHGIVQEAVADPNVFTKETLAQYNGKNGQPAYAAVDGVVYDVSDVFKNGMHKGYAAGQDLSHVYYTAHSKSLLDHCEEVGTYQE